jgi:protein-tyrosine phosphatase
VILFVCTGNVCRSPFAERWLRGALAEAEVRIPVHSAGTQALVGEPMDPATVAVSTGLGLDCSGHEARQLESGPLSEARLVLTASRLHRKVVVERHPPAVKYTFTIRQLGRILAAADPREMFIADPDADPVTALRHIIAAQRGRSHVSMASADDVVDPRGRPPEVHRRSVEQMMPSLQLLAQMLRQTAGGAAAMEELGKRPGVPGRL